MFRRFPRTGVPDHFGSWSEYENYVKLLVDLHCIDDGKKIWWDVRPHPTFGTLEFRICDVPTNVGGRRSAIAALCQAIVVKLHRLYLKNLGFRLYRRALIEENKWRAARWGIDGKLIDFGKRAEVPMRDLALELLEFIDDVVDDLGSREEVNYVHTILREGTSADRQLQVFQETGDLREVVRHLVDETRASTGGAEYTRNMMKIGLLCGREYSFPPAFIERVNRSRNERTASPPNMRGSRPARDGRGAGLPGHRRSHFARGGLSIADT